MFMSQRIGLFGGTFDPPHMGHLEAALAAKRTFLLHRLLFVVANDPWQKSTERTLIEARHRLTMVRMLVEGVAGVEASDLEIVRGGPSYTIETVTELRDQGNEVILVVGADTAAGLDTWERASALRLVFPFKRSWATSIIAGVMLAVFCIPLFTIGGSTDFEGSGDLFSLTSMLFTAS